VEHREHSRPTLCSAQANRNIVSRTAPTTKSNTSLGIICVRPHKMLKPKGKKMQPKVSIAATVPSSIKPVATTTGSSSKLEEKTNDPPSLSSSKKKTNKHNRTKTPATVSIDRKLANEQTESSMPLIDLIWESLAGSALSSEAGTKHLSVNEMKILGEAMCGHVVTTESCIHQIHRCRATLAVAQINNLFVQKFAGSLQSLIRNKSFSREETTQVRDFVNTRLREIIVSGVFAMRFDVAEPLHGVLVSFVVL